jgi:S1-C subfamily serine protease
MAAGTVRKGRSGMRILRNLGRRTGWTISGALIVLSAWFAFPAIAQRLAVSEIAPRVVTPRGDLGADEQRTIDLFQKARGSVVYINTRERVLDPWTRNMFSIPRGTGSGFVWDGRGHIVTNFHVVAGASEARVRLNDGRDSPATLVGASPDHDLAVLRLNVSTSPSPVAIGTSQDLKVGQKVFAIGNPFGLDWTLTTGIISALDRSLPAQDGRTLIEHLIQTDAAINPGNSGGPLLDSAGRLIGVNTAIFSPSGASAGVGFAVPIDTVNRVVPQLIARGKYIRPGLGIAVDEGLNRTAMEQLRVDGVLILRVTPDSPAAAVGLRGVQVAADGSMVPGDIVVAIDGKPVDSVARLLARLDDHQVGDIVRLSILRDGRKTEVTATLAGGAQ